MPAVSGGRSAKDRSVMFFESNDARIPYASASVVFGVLKRGSPRWSGWNWPRSTCEDLLKDLETQGRWGSIAVAVTSMRGETVADE